MDSLHPSSGDVEPIETLSRFRRDFYACLTGRADAVFELTDALLCADGPVRSLVDLSLASEHRRGHGGLYDGLNAGRLEVARLRRTLAGLPLPRIDGRIVLAVDLSPWLRPDAETSPERLFCHVHGRARNTAQMIPDWPYSLVVALEAGRTSWTAVLDAVRLGPADDEIAVTAAQLRDVVDRLREAGQWRPGDPDIWIVMDSGYDVARLAFVLSDLPVVVIGRLRSDRVMLRPVGDYRPGRRGRRPQHGPAFDLKDPATWDTADHITTTRTTRYGTASVAAWNRLHPRLTRSAARTPRRCHRCDGSRRPGGAVQVPVEPSGRDQICLVERERFAPRRRCRHDGFLPVPRRPRDRPAGPGGAPRRSDRIRRVPCGRYREGATRRTIPER